MSDLTKLIQEKFTEVLATAIHSSGDSLKQTLRALPEQIETVSNSLTLQYNEIITSGQALEQQSQHLKSAIETSANELTKAQELAQQSYNLANRLGASTVAAISPNVKLRPQ
jgi:hypothetical protein